jgi:hypothetical protein
LPTKRIRELSGSRCRCSMAPTSHLQSGSAHQQRRRPPVQKPLNSMPPDLVGNRVFPEANCRWVTSLMRVEFGAMIRTALAQAVSFRSRTQNHQQAPGARAKGSARLWFPELQWTSRPQRAHSLGLRRLHCIFEAVLLRSPRRSSRPTVRRGRGSSKLAHAS